MKLVSTMLFLLTSTVSIAGSKSCFNVEGMTCATCSLTLKAAIKKLEGIKNISASVDKAEAIVSYDQTKTTKIEILNQINSTGYKATEKKCKKES